MGFEPTPPNTSLEDLEKIFINMMSLRLIFDRNIQVETPVYKDFSEWFFSSIESTIEDFILIKNES